MTILVIMDRSLVGDLKIIKFDNKVSTQNKSLWLGPSSLRLFQAFSNHQAMNIALAYEMVVTSNGAKNNRHLTYKKYTKQIVPTNIIFDKAKVPPLGSLVVFCH